MYYKILILTVECMKPGLHLALLLLSMSIVFLQMYYDAYASKY